MHMVKQQTGRTASPPAAVVAEDLPVVVAISVVIHLLYQKQRKLPRSPSRREPLPAFSFLSQVQQVLALKMAMLVEKTKFINP